MAGFAIRDAAPADVPVIARFVRDLARYEKLEHEVVATPESFQAALFGPRSNLFGLIAEVDGTPAGFALCFYNFSTFVGRRGIYLEDLYVDPAYRGKGIGKAIFHHLARKAVNENCGRVEWAVLDWNEPAIKFYESLGATPMKAWQVQRLHGAALQALAG
jgi:GNAT superfamily N-acetyltransferase